MEQQMSWMSERRSKWDLLSSSSSYFTPSVPSTITKCDSIVMSDEELVEEPFSPNPDAFIQHCFKRYKLRERFPDVFLKLKPSRFGPPAPRRRILIAPSVQGMPLPTTKPQPPEPLGPKPETFPAKKQLEKAAQTPTEDDKIRELDAWIEERKKLQKLLNKCVNVESWLVGKEPINEQEAHVLTKIRESKNAQKAEMKVQSILPTGNTEQLQVQKKQKRIIPLINAPYPESLITLQNLLHKQKLKLVDIFTKEDRSKSIKFKRADFIKIIRGTQVPISNTDLEDVVVYLTSIKKENYVTHSDLADCQRIWLEHLRDQWKHTREAKPEELPPDHLTTDQKVTTVKRIPSCPSKLKVVPSQKPKLKYLQVPPINTEPERMHLSYNKMEEVGKRYREVKRRLKRKGNPLEWAESCRVVKTGDPVVDNHCLPSTIEGDMGELVDQHRMASHLVWFQCVKICERYGIPLTEELLQRALLFPGDRLFTYDGITHKIRQPGGFYDVDDQQGSLSGSSSDFQDELTIISRETESEQEAEPRKQHKEKPVMGRWRSYMEFKELMSGYSKKLRLTAKKLWHEGSFDKSAKSAKKSQILFEEEFIERELRRMFSFLNPLTDANSFWPGHLLDKLRLYLPQVGCARGDALFSHISCTRPVYSGIYPPRRTWQVSELKFVTYGDTEARKYGYYI